VLLCDLAGQELEVVQLQADLTQIDAGDAVLLTQRFERRDVTDGAISRQTRRESATLDSARARLELLRAERALPQQDFADLLLVAHPKL